MILVIDNYDSFVHTLARYLAELGAETRVVRNDAIDLSGVDALAPDAILLSPGPGRPENAGICLDLVVQSARRRMPLLGVCLGHQAIGAAFGGEVARAREPLHGRASLIRHDGDPLFEGIGSPFPAARYHSLIVRLREGEPLVPLAYSERGELMALKHLSAPLYGVQFHPESVISEHGHRLLQNFLTLAGVRQSA